MARLFFQGVDPVGQHLLMQDTLPGTDTEVSWTIVGVITDERLTPFDDRRERPAAYVPIDQVPTMFAGLVVHTATAPDGLREPIRRAISRIDKDQAIRNVRTVEELEADARAPDRLRTWFLGIFAGLALLLSTVGIYGVFAHAVVQRTHEVGIRAALGARPGHLVWLILRQGIVLSIVGLGVGLVGAVGVTPFLRTFLFGVGPVDPIALGATAVILGAVATGACYIPARRATTIDPIVALRAE
ncbi:MAG TPA: FtsX-like permease family protein [Vicinamibacterales bacterium]|nr:FtsX-like permease family protein [Vicinamibacterales bacterium]